MLYLFGISKKRAFWICTSYRVIGDHIFVEFRAQVKRFQELGRRVQYTGHQVTNRALGDNRA